ncbi:MAG: T9SS type A sorting domain-containing protein, partial [Flammeovirgaceae bacterium]
GSTNITASQSGDANYNVADNLVQTLTVNKANQQITFQAIADKTLSDAPFGLSATSTSGLPISFTSLAVDKVTVNNTQATIVAGGRAIITASQAGNTNYNAAAVATQNFCIKPAKPTVNVSLASGLATLTSSLSGGYKWFLNGTVIPGGTSQSYTATLAGAYKVQVNLDDCLSDFSNDVPVVITGDLSNGTTGVSVYPNPTGNKLYLNGLSSEIKRCMVFDVLGRGTEMSLEKLGDQRVLDVSGLAEGVHVISVNGPNGLQQIRFMKQN